MRTIVTILTIAVTGYFLLAVLLYFLQEKMVFLPQLPGRELDATPAYLGFEFDDVKVVTSDGVRLHGWYVHSAEPRGTVLFFHGNAGNISHRLESIAIFQSLGLDTFIIDYRGYGQSEGKAGERGLYLDGDAAWQYLVEERAIEPSGIVLFGRSMGGAVAARLAARQQAGGAIIESSFTSAPDMAHRLYPFMPVRLISRLRFPVAKDLANSNAPVLVIHSHDDEIIPFEMGRSLYDAAPEPKAFLDIAGDHNTGFLLSEDRYRGGLEAFFDTVL